jgi:pheromone shutdown protein TraB
LDARLSNSDALPSLQGSAKTSIQVLSTVEDADQLRDTVELIKQRQTVRELMGLLEQELPLVYNAMLRERDEYMAKSLLAANKAKLIVAVVGMAHMDGIERELGYSKVPCPAGLT